MTKNKNQNKLSRAFLYILVISASVAVLYLLRPFLKEIIMAAMLASVSFWPYQKLSKILAGRKILAALMMLLLLFIVIIGPLSHFLIYLAKQAPNLYTQTSHFIAEADIIENNLLSLFHISPSAEDSLKSLLANFLNQGGAWLINSTSLFLQNVSSFFLSLFILLLAYFYFLVHGKVIVKKLFYYSPLPQNYNLELSRSFSTISRTALLSVGISAIIQGLLSALGLLILGWPFLLVFAVSALLAVIPYMLTLFYLPIALFLLASGQIWQALLIIIWNMLIVVNIDELIRAYIAKGGTKVNMAFMLFAILGGIALFGLPGVFIGPLITALTLTILNIYAQEFSEKISY
ncbi:MAG: AI-2E family transporter [Patescibacteria group bacterium]|jgi:predicted PurR-regulated permease PerM|nr:AI-2E family transporter [Patescibacteria group bacterium]